MQNKNANKGFTIVELLIVVVVIAILAAITIVSYRGITERAATASISSSIHQWVNLIRTANINNGFTFPDNSATCLGSSSTAFPAANGFASNVCATDGTTSVYYDSTKFSTWPVDQARPAGNLPMTQTVVSGTTLKARGVWVGTSNATSFQLRWIPQISGECALGTRIDSNGNGSTTGGLCGYDSTYEN